MTTRLLIVADIRLYREGLAERLAQCETIAVVGTASCREQAVSATRALSPAVVILDMAAPESLATVRDIDAVDPRVRVVALGVGDREQDVIACAEAGVAAYVPREGSLDDLQTAVGAATRGELHCSPRMAASIVRRLALRATETVQEYGGHLTSREREIVTLIDHGLTNKEIAVRLRIGVATVKNHVHNILEKLHVRRRNEAAASLRHHDGRRVTDRGYEMPPVRNSPEPR